MAAAYPTPPCLSCASTSATEAYALNPFVSRSRGFRAASIAHASLLSMKRRRMKSTYAARVSCAFSNGSEVVTACSWNERVVCSDVPVLVVFWASWCGPCKMTNRVIDELSREYGARIKCFRLDTDEYPQVATFSSIEKIPTVLVFNNGEKVESITGTLPKSVYVNAIERSLAN